MEMGLLERLDPVSQHHIDKLEHIEGAIAHYVYSEEGTSLAKFAQPADLTEQVLITERYAGV
jgi:hypothetical protein